MSDLPPPRADKRLLAALSRDCKGATAVEYGLILALIVLGLIAAIGGLGGQSQSAWDNIDTKVKAVTPK